MRKTAIAVALALLVAGCAQLQSAINGATSIYKFATETTVPPDKAAILATAFDGLKQTAIFYGDYCVQQNFPRPVCSAKNRRIVIKAVNVGTGARDQLEASIQTKQPVLASVYNILVKAVTDLQASPINSVKGS